MKIKFLVAEEIRPEESGKLTILGLFPDDNLVLSAKEAVPQGMPLDTPRGIDKLVFFINLSDASSKFSKFKVTINDPSGELYKPEREVGEGRIAKGESRSFIIEVKPFIIKFTGTYIFNFHVNNKVYSFPFEIRER